MKHAVLGSVLGSMLCLAAVALGACAGPPTGPGNTPIPPPTAASAPSTPSASPTPRTKAQDAAELETAVITAKDLGKPWVRPTSVASNGKPGEICPGHPSAAAAVPTTASVRASLTEGSGTGKNIGVFSLATLARPDATAFRAAYTADHRTCARFVEAKQFSVVRTVEGPTSLEGADEVVTAWSERIYYDKAHRRLAYARHNLVARSGRVIIQVQYAFLAEAADPGAKKFARAERLMGMQLAKVSREVTK